MELRLRQIGTSKGIILSKSLRDKYGFKDKVELIEQDDRIIIKQAGEVRAGWDEAFAKMHKEGDDELLLPDVFEDEETEEW